MRGRMAGMNDPGVARWPFRVLAALVALLAVFALMVSIRILIESGDVRILLMVGISTFGCWRFWRIAATGRYVRPTQQSVENIPSSAH